MIKPGKKGPLDALSAAIQRWRDDNDLSLRAAARVIGVSRATLTAWERGENCPDMRSAELLKRAIGQAAIDAMPEIAPFARPVEGWDEAVHGAWLRETREAQGLSQVELARALGTTSAAVSKWELGVGRPNTASAAMIVDALGDWREA